MRASVRFIARKILPLIADIEMPSDTGKLPKDGYMPASNYFARLDSLVAYMLLIMTISTIH